MITAIKTWYKHWEAKVRGDLDFVEKESKQFNDEIWPVLPPVKQAIYDENHNRIWE